MYVPISHNLLLINGKEINDNKYSVAQYLLCFGRHSSARFYKFYFMCLRLCRWRPETEYFFFKQHKILLLFRVMGSRFASLNCNIYCKVRSKPTAILCSFPDDTTVILWFVIYSTEVQLCGTRGCLATIYRS